MSELKDEIGGKAKKAAGSVSGDDELRERGDEQDRQAQEQKPDSGDDELTGDAKATWKNLGPESEL